MSSKVFISETNLPFLIRDKWSISLLEKEIDKDIILSEEMDTLIENIKSNIESNAKELLKKSKSRLECNYTRDLYINLNDKRWLSAAIISEIFRDLNISKNANELDPKKIQIKIFNAIINGKIEFVIGWGQAKRSCGNLKTDGYDTDFSELYSISILQSIIESIYSICYCRVELFVLTGGSRFYPALFTNKDKIEEYDSQRSIIAQKLCSENCMIKFISYREDISDKLEKLDFYIAKVQEKEIIDNLLTILINIDWYNIIEKRISPHNKSIPHAIFYLLDNNWSINNIIHMAISCIIKKDYSFYWIKKIGDDVIFDEIIDFFYSVSKLSAEKYIAIHLMDNIDNKLKEKLLPNAIRLTVHKKEDRNDIPAIYLLDIDNGNKLSQHNCAVLIDSKLKFMTKLELLSSPERFKALYIDSHKDFSWLDIGKQPLIYISYKEECYLKKISNYRYFYK